ncbi:Torsin-3A [Microtus ochrogaster]|uniref:Torsin-3A n=1 Tax=Microtus ochrogaster TaxID=79684 RepID=A0A8J6GQN0_MICOH|nr:Torsin-3A [Microtus ochrogaster]
MLGGTFRLLLLLLLLPLRPPGTQGHSGAASSGQEDEEPAAWPGVQRLKEQLRTVGTLSKRYWGLFSCTVWPDHCQDQEAPAPPLGWSLPLQWGRRSLDRLTEWFCRFQDCCTGGGDCRISNNLTGLESDLRLRLHGQHLASELVLRAVRGYLEKPQGDKALALSFHGWSGTGKNFVARMLAENLYRDGLRSDCVKMFISTFHFPHPKYADKYKEELRCQMQETRRRCHQTMFIFDEAEKLHPVLLELLGPHLELRVPETQGVEPPRAIFLFLRDSGNRATVAVSGSGASLASLMQLCTQRAVQQTQKSDEWSVAWLSCLPLTLEAHGPLLHPCAQTPSPESGSSCVCPDGSHMVLDSHSHLICRSHRNLSVSWTEQIHQYLPKEQGRQDGSEAGQCLSALPLEQPPMRSGNPWDNLGGSVINKEVLGLLKAGWSREEITIQHLETLLQAEITVSTDSSFGSSRLVKENLIDFFVPFLPLEYRHVRLCVRDAFLSQDLLYTEEALDEIAKMMTYVPEEEQLFSSQGCKSISQRINLFLP